MEQNKTNSVRTENNQMNNSKRLNSSVQKVFTFVNDANSKEIKKSDVNGNNDKSGSLGSSSVNNQSANSNNLDNNNNQQSRERDYSHSPLQQVMKKIGLNFGYQTGHHLNKLIRQKPSDKEFDKDSQSSANIEALLMTDERDGEYWQIIKQSYQRQNEFDEDLTDE